MNEKRTKINKQRPGLAHIFKKYDRYKIRWRLVKKLPEFRFAVSIPGNRFRAFLPHRDFWRPLWRPDFRLRPRPWPPISSGGRSLGSGSRNPSRSGTNNVKPFSAIGEAFVSSNGQGTDSIKILQHKFYAMLFFQAFWLATHIYQPIRMLKNSIL